MSGTLEAVEADLQHALDQVVLAVTRAIPPNNDVIDPQQLVNQWMAQLAPEPRARFLMLILAEGSEARMDGIARAVLAGDDTWHRNEAIVPVTSHRDAPQPDAQPEPA
jgi:hypothetical protein